MRGQRARGTWRAASPSVLIAVGMLLGTADGRPVPARAQDPPRLVAAAQASATAATLSVEGERLTLGVADAGMDTRGTTGGGGDADGTGAVSLPAPPTTGCEAPAVTCASAAAVAPPRGEAATADAPGDPGPAEAQAFALPDALSALLDLDTQPATARAAEAPEAAAVATSGVTTVDVTPTRAMIGDLARTRGLLGRLSERLTDSAGAGDVAGRLSGTLQGLLDDLTGASVASVRIDASHAEADGAPDAPTATATTGTVVVTLVPAPGQLPVAEEGLVVVEAGPAEATVTADADAAQGQVTPAEVTVSVFDPTTGEYERNEVATGAARTCFGPAPLRVCVQGGASDVTSGEHRASATVEGLRLDVLDDPLPTLSLRLADARVELAAAPAPTPETDEGVGAGVTAVAVGLVAALGGAAAVLYARRRPGVQE